jgi:hypothetical protein
MRGILFIAVGLIFLLGCSKGALELVSIDYPHTLKVPDNKIFNITLTIRNSGYKECTITKVWSPHFWEPDYPGLKGSISLEENIVLKGKKEVTIPMRVHLMDADLAMMQPKAFTIYVETNPDDENCDDYTLTALGEIEFIT